MEDDAQKKIAVFDDPKNITVGRARVIYAKACTPIRSSVELPEAWVLPGGARLTEQYEAMAAAVQMDELMSRR